MSWLCLSGKEAGLKDGFSVPKDQTARASEARLLEAQLARERSEVSALRTQLSEAQQADKERSKLADKVQQLEAKLEDRVAERVANKESELHATYDERLRNYADRCVPLLQPHPH